MRIDLTNRAALYCAAVIAMLYALDSRPGTQSLANRRGVG